MKAGTNFSENAEKLKDYTQRQVVNEFPSQELGSRTQDQMQDYISSSRRLQTHQMQDYTSTTSTQLQQKQHQLQQKQHQLYVAPRR